MKAYYSIDAMIYAIPIIFILYLILIVISFSSHYALLNRYSSIPVKLVVASDIAVKYLSINDDGFSYINWVDVSHVKSYDWQSVAKSLGLNEIIISDHMVYGKVCIFRFVLTEDREISRIFVCGD